METHLYADIVLPNLLLGTSISIKSCECRFLSVDYSAYKKLGWMFNLKEAKIMSEYSNQTNEVIKLIRVKGKTV